MNTNFTALQPKGDSPSEFVPVEGGGDTTSGETLLVIAYIVMWMLFFGFVLMTQRRQRGLNDKLAQLEQALKRSEDTAGENAGS